MLAKAKNEVRRDGVGVGVGADSHGKRCGFRVATLTAIVLLGGASAGVAAEGDETAGAPGVGRLASMGIVTGASSPLTALSVTDGAVTCVQSAVAVDAQGAIGVLAPQVGATVIRGSRSTSAGVAWVVVPQEQVGTASGALTTVCAPAQ